jgi:death-on-curing protein
MLIRLTASQIQEIHDHEVAQSGGLPGTKDPGYLDLIAEKPFMEFFGEEMYPGLFLKAAVLMHGLIKAHCSNDGNKRTAVLAALTFLDINGYELDADPDDLFDVAIAVATNEMDANELASWLELHCIKNYP